MSIDFRPSLVNLGNLKMVCTNCNFKSPLFLSACPSCKSSLWPETLSNYFEIKPLLQDISLEEAVNASFFLEFLAMNSFTIPKDSDVNYILNSYSRHTIKVFYDFLHQYYLNFQDLLRVDYLYELKEIIFNEFTELSEKLRFLERKKEGLPPIEPPAAHLRISLLYFYRGTLSSISFLREQTKNKRLELMHSLMYYFLNNEISILKSDLSKSEEDFESLLEFKFFVQRFIESDDLFKKLPKIFLSLVSYHSFPKILNENELEVVYLPNTDVSVVIKKEYSPDVELLESLTRKKGGLTITEIVSATGKNLFDVELMLQVLFKRELMRKTYSYLKGERYFLLG